jgi:beta-lactamase regulating signal transducer with metallopeptidase domain
MTIAGLQSVLQSVFAWTWQNSLAATVLIGLVFLARLICRQRLPVRWQYALWLLVVGRLLLPVAPASRFSLFNLQSLLRSDRVQADPAGGVDAVAQDWRGGTSSGHQARRGQEEGAEQSAAQPEEDSWGRLSASMREAEPHAGASLVQAVQYLWLLGAASYFAVVLAAHWRLAWSLRGQAPAAEERVVSLLAQCRNELGLRREVRVIESPQITTPAVFGFLRPRLLLPAGMVGELSHEQLRFVILHELVHVKRRDVLLNWLLVVVQALHWFNPVVWLAFRRLRADRELVCDAAVLSLLNPAERHTYGGTLIKLAEQLPRACRLPLAPGFVPILCRKPEIERRITMIAKHRPTRRVATLASAILTVGILALTFTRAADQGTLAKPAEASPNKATSEKAKRQRTIRVLEREVRKMDELVASKQAEIDKLRIDLGVSDLEAALGLGGVDPETLRKLEALRIDAKADLIRSETFHSHLTNLTRAELKKAIVTAVPDQQMVDLLSQLHLNEQKMAGMIDNLGPEHPDIKNGRRLLETIHRQVEDRLDGILKGLEAKCEADKARMKDLEKEVDHLKSRSLDSATKSRPYVQAKRDLENLQLVRERLQMRLVQERIDAEIENEP